MFSFPRYLAAKQTVDDRALNDYVAGTLYAALPTGPLHILEVGAGTGAMVERLLARKVVPSGSRYTAIDADPENVAEAGRRFSGRPLPIALEFEATDVYAFAQREAGTRAWDLLVAHAFLDLVDAPRLLPHLFALLRPGGLFYFTLNFDGLTALEPPVDPGFEEQVIDLYHRTMDERLIDGRLSGDSRSGRHLLWQIPAAGGEILAGGPSDWVVLPQPDGYPAEEAYFLRHILHFFETSLTGRPELDAERFGRWLAARRAQIDTGQLIYVAHQLDVCGRVVKSKQ